MKTVVGMICLFFSVALSWAQMPGAATCNLKYGATLNLQKYGGGNVDLIVQESDLRSITVSTIDKDHLLPVPSVYIESGGYWTTPGSSPQRSRKQIEKKNGVAIQGTVSQAYLIYEGSGIKVFYFDSTGAEQNSCILFILQDPKKSGLSSSEGIDKQR